MKSIDFCNTFLFNIYKFNKYHFNDNSKIPACRHYFGCLIKGTAKISTKNEYLELKPGEIFYIPKNLKYQSRWFCDETEKVEFYSFGFDIAPTSKYYVLQKINCSEKAKNMFKELCEEIPFSESGIGKLYRFFGEVSHEMAQAKNINVNPVLEKALEYMAEFPNAKVNEIASFCDVSESGLYLIFKNHHNKTPNEERLDILCKKAVELLTTTDLSVEEISNRLEFSSTSYFRKIFKSRTNKTPLEIRKEEVRMI